MTTPRFDITPLLDQDEGQHYERKSLYEGPEGSKKSRDRRKVRDEVAENVAAFANAEGGVLVLGIEDDDLRIIGHKLPKRALNAVLATPCNRLIPPQPAGFVITVGDHELIVFDIPAEDTPVRVDGDGFPLRIGDKTVQVSESQINALKFEGMATSWESRQSSATLADLDAELLGQARQNAGLSALTDEEYLLKRKLADRRGRGIALRNAAELLFTRNGSEHPNAGVRLFHVIGTERRTGAEYNVEERPRSEGNLPAVIFEISTAISGMLRHPSRLIGNRFQEGPEYPEFAWREALLNAVAHRDYGVTGTGTEIRVFDDRMEVVSPGSLVGNLTLKELLKLERVHHSRNPRIVRVLVDLGFARDQGEGIPRMFAEMADAFLPNPEIDATENNVTITLRNTPTLSDTDRAFISRLDLPELSRNEFRALLHAHRQRQIENAGLRSLSGLDTLSASLVLRGLRDKGFLELHNFGSRSYYTLVPDLAKRNEPEVGELPPEVGELPPEVGELPPEVGELPPEVGELPPEVGELPPEVGELPPEVGELPPEVGELPPEVGELPVHIRERITNLGERPRREHVHAIIQEICAQGRWVTSAEIARYINFKQGNLTWHYLSRMVESGLLERRFPDNLTHPQQAYRAITPQLALPLMQ